MPTDDDKFVRQALHIFSQFASHIRCSPEDLAKERGAVLEVPLPLHTQTCILEETPRAGVQAELLPATMAGVSSGAGFQFGLRSSLQAGLLRDICYNARLRKLNITNSQRETHGVKARCDTSPGPAAGVAHGAGQPRARPGGPMAADAEGQPVR